MCRILVVDDDDNIQQLLTKGLPEHRVKTTGCVRDAIKTLSEFRPSLVFLDINMPGQSGDALFEHLDNDCVVIVITGGKITEEYEIDLIERGALEVIPKPFSVRKMRAITGRVDNMLRHECHAALKKRKNFIERLSQGADTLRKVQSRLDEFIPQEAPEDAGHKAVAG